jgi:hypothetical protein
MIKKIQIIGDKASLGNALEAEGFEVEMHRWNDQLGMIIDLSADALIVHLSDTGKEFPESAPQEVAAETASFKGPIIAIGFPKKALSEPILSLPGNVSAERVVEAVKNALAAK